jgi:16S rRNA (guanine527-N7)-methyltransferase
MTDPSKRERKADPERFHPDRYAQQKFPDDAWAWFAGVCKEMEIPLGEKQRNRMEALYSHLIGVNEWMNLTRITDPLEYLKFHMLDSLTVLPDVMGLTGEGDICVDLGSGGGYPGLPLMLFLPDRKWVLVDSRKKKVAFLAEAVKLTGCANAEARAFRGNEAAAVAPDIAGRTAIVLARAVGPAPKIMIEAAPILKMGGHLLVLKGPAYDRDERKEVQRSAGSLGFEQVDELAIHLDENDPERLILVFRKEGDV